MDLNLSTSSVQSNLCKNWKNVKSHVLGFKMYLVVETTLSNAFFEIRKIT